MTAHPIDTEALRDAVSDHEPDDHGPGKCGKDDCFASCAECGEEWPCLWSSLPDLLAAAEHRATRAEAQVARMREVLASHPTPDCEQYPGVGDSLGSCGWKSAYAGVIWALDGET